jgi:hypothetical protein
MTECLEASCPLSERDFVQVRIGLATTKEWRGTYTAGKITSVGLDLTNVERVERIVNGLSASIDIHNGNARFCNGIGERRSWLFDSGGPVKEREAKLLCGVDVAASYVFWISCCYALSSGIKCLL